MTETTKWRRKNYAFRTGYLTVALKNIARGWVPSPKTPAEYARETLDALERDPCAWEDSDA